MQRHGGCLVSLCPLILINKKYVQKAALSPPITIIRIEEWMPSIYFESWAHLEILLERMSTCVIYQNYSISTSITLTDSEFQIIRSTSSSSRLHSSVARKHP